jgi:DNA polymerase elongation subunit (family B)
MASTTPKILYFDIESSVNTNLIENYGLKLYNNYLNPDTIVQDWNIFCISYCWMDIGSAKRVVKNICVDPENPQDDFEVVTKFYDILAEADIVVGHNVDKFDLKSFRTRAIHHGLPPLPKFKVVDTLKQARRIFRFTSNKLSYLALFLGVAEKGDSPDWRKVRAGDAQEIKRMVKYCNQDVHTGMAIHDKLRPWDTSYPNLNEYKKQESEHGCPSCGSHDHQRRGERNGYYRFQCNDCGSWFKEPCKDLKIGVKFKNG